MTASQPDPVELPHSTERVPGRRFRFPLYAQIFLAVTLGVLLGSVAGRKPFLPGGQFGNDDLGQLAVLLTTILKTLASPLIFFAVLDAFLRTHITWQRGSKLLLFCLINVTAAMTIGLFVMNTWQPGETWRGRAAEIAEISKIAGQAVSPSPSPGTPQTLTVVESLRRIVPTSVVQPFAEGNLMGLILLAILLGAACRSIRNQQTQRGESTFRALEEIVETIYEMLLRILEWIVRLVPLAVFGAVAQSVSVMGLEVFHLVGVFLVSILAGLALHAFGYYSLAVWLWGGRSPRVFLKHAFTPFLTALSTNSSLATIPVTLRSLTKGLGVSDESARLSACVGTNFNNDGITLYEAMTAIFLAQAAGLGLTLGLQIQTVLICVLVSLGAAGIPQGGLAVLPLVLASTGLPAEWIASAMPLIMAVDWIIARVRSCVNVLGDMAVAIQLDGRPLV